MSHFAKIENNIVTDVIVAELDFIQTLPGTWVQTSYNTKGGVHYNAETNIPSDDQSRSLRKNYAGVGYTYDSIRDAFIPPKPFDSWVLDEQTCLWVAPVQQPVEDGKFFYWNEELQNWLEILNE